MTDTITDSDKLKCAQRELRMRERVYPRWVQSDKISVGKMEHELACMRAIVADYEAKVQKERLL